MTFSELPTEVQQIAAQALENWFSPSGIAQAGYATSANELAREIKEAFTELYSPAQVAPSLMGEVALKHVIALLLEDVKRLQQIEPNAGTEARIWVAKEALDSGEHEKAIPYQDWRNNDPLI